MKKCPFDKTPCIREECEAWYEKKDLEILRLQNPDAYENTIMAISAMEHCSAESAKNILELRNNDERCLLIKPECIV